MAFQPGYAMTATWTPTGGAAQSIQVTGVTGAESVNALEVTNTASGGQTSYVAGVLTNEVSIDFNIDLGTVASGQQGGSPNGPNNPFLAASGLVAGKKGLFAWKPWSVGTGVPTNPWSIPLMLEKLEVRGQVGTIISITVSGKLDSMSGTYSYPS